MSPHPTQQSTDQHSPTPRSHGAPTPVAMGKPAGAEPGRPSRLIITVGAICMGVVIVLEPLVINPAPGLQIFQAALMAWLWALFMFGTSDRATGRQ